MFSLSKFKDCKVLLPNIEKLNYVLEKEYYNRASKILEELFRVLNQDRYPTQITFIFSMIAEKHIKLLPSGVIKKTMELVKSDTKDAIKVNCSVIIGQYLLQTDPTKERVQSLVCMVADPSLDVRNNVLYFLQQLEDKIDLTSHYKAFLDACFKEVSTPNIVILLDFIVHSMKNADINILFQVRTLLLKLLSIPHLNNYDYQLVLPKIESMIERFYSLFITFRPSNKKQTPSSQLESSCLMERVVYPNNSSYDQESHFTEIIDRIDSEPLPEELLRFSIIQESGLYVYVMEKNKLISFFDIDEKLSSSKIALFFSPIIDDEEEVQLVMKRLKKMGYVEGYYSELGFLYSHKPLISLVKNKLHSTGKIDTHKFNYLPPEFVNSFIQKMLEESGDVLLQGKEKNVLFSRQQIYQNLTTLSKKQLVVDLTPYQEQLSELDFTQLIRNLPLEYFSPYRFRAYFLTIVGKNRILTALDFSRSVGFFNLENVSQKLSIPKELVSRVVSEKLDPRTGFYDKEKKTFYYTPFIKKKVDTLQEIADKAEREREIHKLARQLNIEYSHFSEELAARMEKVRQEILQSDQISISRYSSILGLDHHSFMAFIVDTGIHYFVQGDLIILNPEKVAKAENEVKTKLQQDVERNTIVHLSYDNFKLSPQIINQMTLDLYKKDMIKGVFNYNGTYFEFYPEKIIRDFMVKNRFHFTFHDIAPSDSLSLLDTSLSEIDEVKKFIIDKEKSFFIQIVNGLIKDKEIEGKFDKKNLSFDSYDWTFARSFEEVVQRCSKEISQHFPEFEHTHMAVKKILMDRKKARSPKAVDVIESEIKKIQSKFETWRGEIYGIIQNANNDLFNKKSIEKLKNAPKNITRVEEEPHLAKLLEKFESWTHLINEIQFKYGSVIYYYKWLDKNPESQETQEKLDSLCKTLKLL